MLETVIGLARPDKFVRPIADVKPIVIEIVDDRGIEFCDLPPAIESTRLALSAAHRYRSDRHGLNLGDCLHYACTKYFDVPMLASANEFVQTAIKTVPYRHAVGRAYGCNHGEAR